MLLLCWIPCKLARTNHPFPPFGWFFFADFLNGWALPKSSLNNDAHNLPFCTSARSRPISGSSWLHMINLYIPHQASLCILAIHSLYNSNQLSGESIHFWFQFVARLSRPRSHTPYDTFYNYIIYLYASPRRTRPCNLFISCNLHYHFEKSHPNKRVNSICWSAVLLTADLYLQSGSTLIF